MIGPRALYDLWAPTYQSLAHNPLMKAEQAVVRTMLRSVPAARELDLGTGSGRYLREMAATGVRTPVGLDFSLEMLARAPKIGWRVCADARQLPFGPASFDFINASLMAGDVQDLRAWLGEVAGVLIPGGHLVYSDFHPAWKQRGWRRTFQLGKRRTVELPFYSHGIDEHLSALRFAGFGLLALHEVPLADDGAPEVQAFRARWGNPPVLVVVHARRGAA